MQPENKAKTLALKSIMNNPKLSRILEDGFNSPIGSTKRDQCRSIVSIIKKIGSPSGSDGQGGFSFDRSQKNTSNDPYKWLLKKSNDGQGGTNPLVSGFNPLAPGTSYAVSPDILKRAPVATGVNFGYDSSPKTGFQSDVSAMKNYVGSSPTAFQETLEKNVYPVTNNLFDTGYNVAKLAGAGALAVGQYVPQGILDYFTKPSGEGIKLKDTFGGKIISDVNNFYPAGTTVKKTNITPAAPPGNAQSVLSPAVDPAGNPISSDAKPGSIVQNDGKTYTYINNDGTIHYGTIGDNYADKTVSSSTSETPAATPGTTETGSTDGTTLGANPLVGTPLEGVWATLSDDVKNSLLNTLSKGQFSTITMADRAKLRAIFPGVPEDQLPFGAGLQGQIDSLQKRLWEEHGLDQLANEKMNLINSGATLSTDLTDYMKGRDTYIKDVNQMIKGVKDNMKTGNDSPAAQRMNKDYLDYLTILKGRQNNRYIDLLNTSVSRHDAKVANITNQYNTMLADYNADLSRDAQITVDKFAEMKTNLEEMWSAVQGAPEAARNAEMQRLQIDKAKVDNLTSALKLSGDGTQAAKDNKLMEDIKVLQPYILSDETVNNPNPGFRENINLAEQALTAYNAAKNPEATLDILRRGIANTDPATSKILVDRFIADGGDKILEAAGYTGVPVSEKLKAFLAEKIINTFVSDIETNSDVTKKLVTWLAKLNPKDLAKKKKEFDSQASSLTPALKDAIWNFYTNVINTNQIGADAATPAGRLSVFKNFLSSEGKSSDLAELISK